MTRRKICNPPELSAVPLGLFIFAHILQLRTFAMTTTQLQIRQLST